MPLLPFLSPLSSSTIGATLMAPNVINLITVQLSTPEDFLSWHTQFMAILVSHGLLYFMDGSYRLPASVLTSSTDESIRNPDFSNWMRALELKCMLTTIHKSDSQSMDAYLCDIKTITDNLAVVNSLIPQSDLVHYALLGLSQEYETLVTTLTHVPMNLTFDDLCRHLLLYKQCLKILRT
ncbi:hypothetical protein Cgig2_006435 [Carnegiea gigantea]|uniref:Uncharacterized protein n=1 Tax=Carnegiea gigantea TaxID=171969 RepID=A0A9Q1KAC0_9CARY|nr:hypothetical protein Cgig2_006435 [Carnegiea gigantea]